MQRSIYLLEYHEGNWLDSFSKWCCLHVNPSWKIHLVTKHTVTGFVPVHVLNQIKNYPDNYFELIMIYLMATYGGIAFVLSKILWKRPFEHLSYRNEKAFFYQDGIFFSAKPNVFLKSYLEAFLNDKKVSPLRLQSMTTEMLTVFEKVPPNSLPSHPIISKVAKLHRFQMVKDQIYTFRSMTVNLFPSLYFLHVGKCGGTSLAYHFLKNGIHLQQYHLHRPSNTPHPDQYFLLWIRNPFSRFVSAFYHSKNRIEGDVALVPYRQGKKYIFSSTYDNLIRQLHTPNELAEKLSSGHPHLREIALHCMSQPEEHIWKGLGYYTNNGEFIRHNKSRIFVGRTENFKQDLITFVDQKLHIPFSFQSEKKIRKNENQNDTFLSEKAIENIRDFYKETDFKTLKILLDSKLISKETFLSYQTYPFKK